MITFVTHVQVRPENTAKFEALLNEVCAKVREHEPGVLHYSFAKGVQDEHTYVVIEVYRDAQAHKAHMAAEWVVASIPKSRALVEKGRFDIKQYVTPGTLPLTR